MGHSIRAVLGPLLSIQKLADGWDCAEVIELPQGTGMVFLTDAFLDRIAERSGASGALCSPALSYLTAAADQFLRRASLRTRLVYLETSYFGGAGTQAGALYEDGQIQTAPRAGEGTINRLLRELGVRRSLGRDEFDSLGLGAYRRMED